MDTKLKRDVAIKILPEEFSRDPDRVSRFKREAQVLASLNHPNIAAIYDLQEAGGAQFLVLELVEGETLAERIARGPISVEEALSIAENICEALEAAHERGIIHRDLKPSNVKVTPEGKAKVLDFGLAKAMENAPASTVLSSSPTMLSGTIGGMILGTAAYMSPEQASGKLADRRSDIWSLGAVLYEMLAGKKAFDGETVSDVLASVLKLEPDWKALPAGTPVSIQNMIRRCLTKDRKQRLQAIGEARIALEAAPSEDTPVKAAPGWPVLWIAATAAAVLAFAALAFIYFREVPPAREPVRFQIPLPAGMRYTETGAFSVSPDGRKVVFAAVGPDGVSRLWLRSLDSLEIKPLTGTEKVGNVMPPIWSPDSRFIALDSHNVDGKLKKIDISGGTAQSLCDLALGALGGAWGPEGVILFGTTEGIMRVSSSSRVAVPVTDSARERLHAFPAWLPDGHHFLYLRRAITAENSGIYVGSVDLKPEQQSKKQVLATAIGFTFLPPAGSSRSGQLLFIREGTLLSQTFDTQKLELTGEPTAVVEQLAGLGYFGNFSASPNGVLIYRGGIGGEAQLTWFDRHGKPVGTVGEPGQYVEFALSRDGMKVAASEIRSGNEDVWIFDAARRTRTRLTSDPALDLAPRWSPNGSRIVFVSNRSGHMDLYVKAADGTGAEQPLYESNDNNIRLLNSWSRDGRYLLFTVMDPKNASDLMVLPMEGGGKPFPFVQPQFSERNGDFSPNGRWVAYQSNESGRMEVYVRPFQRGGEVQVSTEGGLSPRWRDDGKELFYQSLSGRLMAVSGTTTGTEFYPGTPEPLFNIPVGSSVANPWFEVSPDAKRFLFKVPVEQNAVQPLTVVLNWHGELTARENR
jgi:Tol biopolymer transport system component